MKFSVLLLSFLMFSNAFAAQVNFKKKNKITIMTFNVENLFDTGDAPNKEDETFLPLTKKNNPNHISYCRSLAQVQWQDQCLNLDWSEDAVNKKLKRIALAIRQVSWGKGPDIIAFQEVENKPILERLRKEFLKGLGYKETILIEGKDSRGIDVAFMSKFKPVGDATLHEVNFRQISPEQLKDTRGILEQSFELPNGQVITGFNVHFPAPFLPYELRVDSYKYLNKLLKQKDAELIFASGDFNTVNYELYELKLLDNIVRNYWQIPHETLCRKCKGTNYYPPKKSWAFLDMFLLSNDFQRSDWRIRKIGLANKLWFQRTLEQKPKQFTYINGKAKGLSDHWPMVIQLVLDK